MLYFFLLVLGVPFNFISDTILKYGRLSKTFLEKGLEFVLYKGVDSILLSLSLILLPPKIDPFSEKQGRKRYAFVAFSISCFKIILILPAKVIAFYVQALIV